MAHSKYDLKINNCQIIQRALQQLKDGHSYAAAAVHISYGLRVQFAKMSPPHQPREGCLVDASGWQKQLNSRGFYETDVWLLIKEAKNFSGFPLRNGTQQKLVKIDAVNKGATEKCPPISGVREKLREYGSLIGVINIRKNYDCRSISPYYLDKEAEELGKHTVVLLAFREVCTTFTKTYMGDVKKIRGQ